MQPGPGPVEPEALDRAQESEQALHLLMHRDGGATALRHLGHLAEPQPESGDVDSTVPVITENNVGICSLRESEQSQSFACDCITAPCILSGENWVAL